MNQIVGSIEEPNKELLGLVDDFIAYVVVMAKNPPATIL
jgi:hypothetical protein